MVLLYRPGAAWTADPYVLSPGRKSPLTLFAAEHFPGGISGYEAAETPDENPAAHVAVVRRVPLAHLRHTLGVGSTDWTAARRTLAGTAHPSADSKPSEPTPRDNPRSPARRTPPLTHS